MKRKVISLLLTATMVLAVFSGCGGKEEGKKPVDPAPDDSVISGDEPTEVHPEVTGTVTVGINAERNSDYEALAEAFEKMYPNVKVEPVIFESSGDNATQYCTTLTIAGEPLPDILFDDAGNMPTYIQNGWMYPLTSFVEGDEEFKNVPQNIVDHLSYNGNIYALGQTLQSNMVMVNEDLIEELNIDPPELDWNWDEFTEFIKTCTNVTYSGIQQMGGWTNWIPGTMVDGCTVAGYQYESNTFNLDAVRQYVNLYHEIADLKGVEADSLNKTSGSGENDYMKKFGTMSSAFEAGKVATTFVGTWSYDDWKQKDVDFNWDFYPVPQCVEGRVPIHVDYCWMSTSVEEENLEAAWAFLRFITYSKEGNLARLTSYDEDHITNDLNFSYYIPCTRDEEVIEKFRSLPYVTDKILYIYDNLENGYLGDPEKTVPGFEAVIKDNIINLADDATLGVVDFSSKMMDAQEKANAEIEKYMNIFNEALAKFETEFAASH